MNEIFTKMGHWQQHQNQTLKPHNSQKTDFIYRETYQNNTFKDPSLDNKDDKQFI